MNRLQRLPGPEQYCVTLNGDDLIAPDRVLRRFVFHHPVFTRERSAAQRRHAELLNTHRTSYCGAYWRNGFHEDGLVSAMAVCQALAGAAPATPRALRDDGSVWNPLHPPVCHAELPL
jgi:predicted NAD/FAD-binding protein